MLRFSQKRNKTKMPRETKPKEIEVVIDVETTGLDYTRERIIEFAGVKLVNGRVKE